MRDISSLSDDDSAAKGRPESGICESPAHGVGLPYQSRCSYSAAAPAAFAEASCSCSVRAALRNSTRDGEAP